MKLNDQHRSMIASAFVAAYNTFDIAEAKARSLCCGPTCSAACAAIVGERNAERLRTFVYESLGCAGAPSDPEYHARTEQYYLDKIAALEEL